MALDQVLVLRDAHGHPVEVSPDEWLRPVLSGEHAAVSHDQASVESQGIAPRSIAAWNSSADSAIAA